MRLLNDSEFKWRPSGSDDSSHSSSTTGSQESRMKLIRRRSVAFGRFDWLLGTSEVPTTDSALPALSSPSLSSTSSAASSTSESLSPFKKCLISVDKVGHRVLRRKKSDLKHADSTSLPPSPCRKRRDRFGIGDDDSDEDEEAVTMGYGTRDALDSRMSLRQQHWNFSRPDALTCRIGFGQLLTPPSPYSQAQIFPAPPPLGYPFPDFATGPAWAPMPLRTAFDSARPELNPKTSSGPVPIRRRSTTYLYRYMAPLGDPSGFELQRSFSCASAMRPSPAEANVSVPSFSLNVNGGQRKEQVGRTRRQPLWRRELSLGTLPEDAAWSGPALSMPRVAYSTAHLTPQQCRYNAFQNECTLTNGLGLELGSSARDEAESGDGRWRAAQSSRMSLIVSTIRSHRLSDLSFIDPSSVTILSDCKS